MLSQKEGHFVNMLLHVIVNMLIYFRKCMGLKDIAKRYLALVVI